MSADLSSDQTHLGRTKVDFTSRRGSALKHVECRFTGDGDTAESESLFDAPDVGDGILRRENDRVGDESILESQEQYSVSQIHWSSEAELTF